MRYVVLGTAGHIDHGKSSLVKALTGTDPDRLKEEKERGITIDLGFANLDYPEDALTVGIIDVPGHERLIRNMLAGTGGIDMVMLVIAADEGIMPQSREHLQICGLLRVSTGLAVVTKSDLVEKDWLELVVEETREFLRGTFLDGADVVAVSAKTGHNLELLKDKIRELGLKVKPKPAGGLFRMPVDRVFTLKGFGTVITGTALSGSVRVEEPVEILPKGLGTRVRGIQSHGRPVKEALAGQRAALNLQGIEKDELSRGDVVVSPGRFMATTALDVKLELLDGAPDIKTGHKVHFHLGTLEAVARVVLYGRQILKAGEASYGQIRLGEPVVAQGTDRFVIRRFSPLETIGGGSVLDPAPRKRRKKEPLDDLRVFEEAPLKEKLAEKLRKASLAGMGKPALEGWIRAEIREIDAALGELQKESRLVSVGDTLIHDEAVKAFSERAVAVLREFHEKNPLRPGMPKEELRAAMRPLSAGAELEQKVFSGLLSMVAGVVSERDSVRLASFAPSLSGGEEARTRERILKEIGEAGFQPPMKEEFAQKLALDEKRLTDILNLMSKEGSLVRVSESLYLTAASYEKMLSLLKGFFSGKPAMTVSEFRDILGTTRKFALPLLEYLDGHKITLRVGDIRKLLIK